MSILPQELGDCLGRHSWHLPAYELATVHLLLVESFCTQGLASIYCLEMMWHLASKVLQAVLSAAGH